MHLSPASLGFLIYGTVWITLGAFASLCICAAAMHRKPAANSNPTQPDGSRSDGAGGEGLDSQHDASSVENPDTEQEQPNDLPRAVSRSPNLPSGTIVGVNKNGMECAFSLGVVEIVAERDCAICMLQYKLGDVTAKSAASQTCSHMFHLECIHEWLSHTTFKDCPCCREPFVDLGQPRRLASAAENVDPNEIEMEV